MNKEQQDIILDVYREHCLEQSKYLTHGGTIQEFIKKIKTDDEFAKKWGLKMEERELSLDERNEWFQIHLNGNNPFMRSDWKDFELDQQNIPTKQITLEYNNEKTYYYE